MTRAELFALVERYLKRNDLADLYGDFLEMAEARINAVMRLPEMEFRATSKPIDPFWLLPDDFLELRHIQAEISNGQRPLEYITPEQADIVRRKLNSTGGYAFYTILDNQLEIIPHPSPESESEVEIFYYAKVPPLVNNQDTGPVLINYPNLYVYAMLGEAGLYREAPVAQGHWFNSFDAYAYQLNARAEAARYSGNSMQLRAV